MTPPLLDIRDLRMDLPGPRRERRLVLRDVAVSVSEGEAVGLVGESGSGKSMTARAVLQLLPAGARTTGTVRFRGTDVLTMSRGRLQELRAREVAMIFQDPRATVNPVRTVGDFLVEGLTEQGVDKNDAQLRVLALLEEIGVDRPHRRMDQRPHELSGGLLQRVVIAAALAAEPALLLADEPTTALDVTTQEEVLAILDEQRRKRGLAMLLITHDLELAAAVCDRIVVMYAGEVVEILDADALHSRARHPYTRALMASRPGSAPAGEHLAAIPGRPQSAYDAPALCVFSDRCSIADETCQTVTPPLLVSGANLVRCHHPREGSR